MDSRKKKVLTVLVAGTIILAWRIVAIVVKYFPSTVQAAARNQELPPAGASRSTGAVASVDVADDLKVLLSAQEVVIDQPWGRDPFAEPAHRTRRAAAEPVDRAAPTNEAAPPAPQVRFTGVSRVGDSWLAAVDGRIVRVGDAVAEQFRVREISRTSLTLESNAWTYEFRLGAKEPDVRRLSEEP